jgi:hypothetical protein
MRFRKGQRDLNADKLMDSSNLALGALVFSQMVADKVHFLLLCLGLLLYIFGWYSAIRLKKGRRHAKS